MAGWLAALGKIGAAVLPGLMDMGGNAAGASSSENFQAKAMHHSVAWRVADAKRAGIHPLYALGMPAMSPAPTQFNTEGAFQNMGQNFERARMAQLDADERAKVRAQTNLVSADQVRANKLSLDNMELQNALLLSQVVRSQGAQMGAPGPTVNAPVGSVNRYPDSVTVGSVGAPEQAPGNVTDYSFGEAGAGRYTIVPSSDMKQRVEDMPSEWQWFLRNGLFPDDNVFRNLERRHPSRPGYEWRYDPIQGRFWQRRLQGRQRHY